MVISEAFTNPTLADAWQRVFDPSANPSPADQQFLHEQVEAGIKKFAKELKNRVDPVATADRDAVAQAVRRAAYQPPSDDGVDENRVARISDGEFEEWM